MYRQKRHIISLSRVYNGLGYRFASSGTSKNSETSKKNNKGKENTSNDNNNINNNNNNNSSSGFSGLFGGNGGVGGIPNFDAQKLRAMQEMISSQPPDKQMEMMKKALEFQKTFGKIPGLGKLAQKNIDVMEQVLKNLQGQNPQQDSVKTTNSTNSSSPLSGKKTSFSNFFPSTNIPTPGTSTGPTIDELKKINLGPEIEALFTELSTMRAKKNSYRSKLLSKEEEVEKLQKELTQLRETDINLRAKLRKVEQDVMLLNSENMELKEHEKEWRQVKRKNEELTDTVYRMQNSDASQDRQRSDILQQQLKEKDDALRSLQRKLERLRRRDPLLQFSRLCSNVARLCDSTKNDSGKEISDDAFAALQSCYELEQEKAWKIAMENEGAAARAYTTVVRRFFNTRILHANYDAIISIDGNVESLKLFVKNLGFELQSHSSSDRYIIVAPANTVISSSFLGPYTISVAIYLASKGRITSSEVGKELLDFKLTSVHPHISSTLFNNSQRAVVQYETARSSGPGGQAANVSETQIIARLLIDGELAYVAEAQDSRSALNNRETATEKLSNSRRVQYNEQLVRQQRVEVVEKQLIKIMKENIETSGNGNNNNNNNNNITYTGLDVAPSTVVDLVRCAVEKGYLSRVELELVCGLHYLSFNALNSENLASGSASLSSSATH